MEKGLNFFASHFYLDLHLSVWITDKAQLEE